MAEEEEKITEDVMNACHCELNLTTGVFLEISKLAIVSS